MVVVVALVSASVHAGQPSFPAFADGRWYGVFSWDSTVEFDVALGETKSSGNFSLTFQGGLPTGEYTWVTNEAVGTTDEARADLTISSTGVFSGRAESPLLVPSSLSVTGQVEVFGIDTFPVEFSVGAGDLVTVPLDIVRAGCTSVSGNFTTRVTEFGEQVSGLGGSVSVQKARWSAIRTGDTGTSQPEQAATIEKLLADGKEIADGIDKGTFDHDALSFLIFRAEQIANAIKRNDECNIANPGLFMTVVAGVVVDILSRMVANRTLFDIEDFRVAVVAGVESGAIGASAGPSAAQLTTDIKNALREFFAAAAAISSVQDLADVATVALVLGDDELVALVIAELNKL